MHFDYVQYEITKTKLVAQNHYNLSFCHIGPDDPLFKRFQSWFRQRAQEARGDDAAFPDPALFAKWEWERAHRGPLHASLTWVREQLENNMFPRGDYREFCELINLILGGQVR